MRRTYTELTRYLLVPGTLRIQPPASPPHMPVEQQYLLCLFCLFGLFPIRRCEILVVRVESSRAQMFLFVSDSLSRSAYFDGLGLGENGTETKDRLRPLAKVAVVFSPGREAEAEDYTLEARTRKVWIAN